jgi:hypothetical protein
VSKGFASGTLLFDLGSGKTVYGIERRQSENSYDYYYEDDSDHSDGHRQNHIAKPHRPKYPLWNLEDVVAVTKKGN